MASTEDLCPASVVAGGEGGRGRSVSRTARTPGVLTLSPPTSGAPSPGRGGGGASRGHCGGPWMGAQGLALGPFPSPRESHPTFRRFLVEVLT